MPWSRDDSGAWLWREPRWTLGWQVQDWAETYFRVPGGPFYGQPLVFTGWQSMFLADWYAVDQLGRWVYPRGLVRLAKKSGKSPVGGVVLAANFCGPTQFDGFDAAGQPVGRPPDAPWCQVMAVSEDQTANTYTPFATMLRESDLVDELGLDIGVSMTVFRGRREAKAEVVTSAAGSREGQPTTGGVVGDEGQSWTRSNGGKRLYRTARRNCAPLGARVLMLANAYEPGVESVAEDIELSSATDGSLVYGPQWQVEGTDLSDPEQVKRNLLHVYRDVPWADVDSIATDLMTPDQDVFEVQRFYFNWPVGDGAMLCPDPSGSVDELEDGAPVAIGFHGGRPKQAASLVAVHMVTGVAYLLGSWERPTSLPVRQPWEVDRGQVEAVVADAFSRYSVAHLKANPSGWRDEVARWKQEWGKDVVTSLPRSDQGLVDEAVDATQTALQHNQLVLSSNEVDGMLAVHVRRCLVSRRTVGSKVIRSLVAPEDGPIDCAVALSWAWQGRLEALAKGWVYTPKGDVLQAVW